MLYIYISETRGAFVRGRKYNALLTLLLIDGSARFSRTVCVYLYNGMRAFKVRNLFNYVATAL